MRDIEMFVAVVEAGSLSAAAQRLARSQPTVTRHLAALEARLGARLLERTTRKIRLTAAGRAYFQRCAAIIALARDADAAVAETHRAMRGAIRLSAPPTYARTRIAPLVPDFLASFPDLRLEMVLTGTRADVVGEPLDLVVRLGPLPDSTLACRLLSREHFVLCAAPAYLARHGTPATVADLATRKCLVTETFGLRSRWMFGGARRQVVDVPACLVSDDLGMLHAAARCGLGIGALPSYLVGDDLRAGTLAPVLPRERLPAFTAHVVLPSRQHVPRRVGAFVDFLAARLRRATRLSRAPPSPRRGR
ncbi:MAG: LysR family transcriptional regulator [Candidatus Binatia bacterium]